jgi:Pectate lyase superfamily protein
MTISASGPTYVQAPGNGVSTVFAFPFKIFQSTDLVVGFITSSGYTQQTSGFTVQGVDNNGGGQITFTTAPPVGTTVDIRSLTPEIQNTEFANLGTFLPETHTEAFDRLTRIVQDLYRLAYTFGIHGPDQEDTPWTQLPVAATRAGQMLTFDSNGLPLCAPQPNSGATQQEIGLLIYPTLSTETGVSNNAYPWGHAFRYGATGNGVTNDAPAIANALLSAAASLNANQVGRGGGTGRVYLPSGNYLTTATLNRPAGVYLVGDGPECTSITASGNYPIIATTGSSSNVLNRGGVQGICLNGTWGTNNANTASIGISESWTNRSIHRDVRFHGCYQGFYGLALWQVVWDNLHADGAGTQQNDFGFYLDQLPTTFPAGTSNAVKAIHCVAQNTGTAGFKLLNPNGSFFASCEAMNGVTGWDIGNHTASGFYPCEFVQFVNCTADTNSANGWQIQQGSNATSPTYIQLANCWGSTHGQYGFYLNGCKYINISNPQSGNNTQGAVLISQSQYCSVIGGEFQSNNQGNQAGIGDIWIAGGSYNVVMGNTSNMANSASPSVLESASTNNNLITKNNLFQGATIIGSASKVTDNQGYNPVGYSGPIAVGASPATITAAASPETHYLTQSATNTATVTAGGGKALGTLSAGTTLVVQLDPGGTYQVTWTTTAPTYTKYIH